MKGDNTSRCETLKIMFERSVRENIDIAQASPYAYGGGIEIGSFFRTFLSHGGNFLIKLFLDIHGIHTFSSFFRLYTGASIIKLQKFYGPEIISRSGFESVIELLVKIISLKMSISEVPMKLDWSLRKGKSKMKILNTIVGYLKLIFTVKKEIVTDNEG